MDNPSPIIDNSALLEIIDNATAVILSGGDSTRMGEDKAALKIDGASLLERVASIVVPLFNETIISTRHEYHKIDGIKTIIDGDYRKGPASGLLTSMEAMTTDWAFCIASDMPLIEPSLIAYLASLRESYNYVVPYTGEQDTECQDTECQIQPLFAFYHKSTISELKDRILNGERGLCKYLNSLDENSIRKVMDKEMIRFDPELKSFIDVDKPEEFRKVAERFLTC